MSASCRLHWLKRVAATSAMLVGGAGATALSPQALGEIIEAAERVAEDENGGCARVLQLLARDPRPAVRGLVAEALGVLPPERDAAARALLRELARDESAHVRSAAALGLARTIHRATPPERIELVCEWALSDDCRDRAAVARALAWPTPVFVTDLVVEQLARDEDSEVRALALQAALSHAHQDPATYRRLATELLTDPHEPVRHAAERVLARV